MKKIKFLKFICIFFATFCISFLCLSGVKAQKVECIYKRNLQTYNDSARNVNVTFKIGFDTDEPGSITKQAIVFNDESESGNSYTFGSNFTVTNFLSVSESDDTKTVYKCPPLNIGCISDAEGLDDDVDNYTCAAFIQNVTGAQAGVYIETIKVTNPDASSTEATIESLPGDPGGSTVAAMDCNYTLDLKYPAAAKITLRYKPENNISINWYYRLQNPNYKFAYEDYSLAFRAPTQDGSDTQKALKYIKANKKCPPLSAKCNETENTDSKYCSIYYGDEGPISAEQGLGGSTFEDISSLLDPPGSSGPPLNWSDVPAVLATVFSIGASSDLTCEDALGGESDTETTLDILKLVFSIIRVGAVMLLIVLTAVDFVKSVAASDENAFKKATNIFTKRAVITVAIFLLPSIIELITTLTLIGNGSCGIG